jgi:hypothetical protein
LSPAAQDLLRRIQEFPPAVRDELIAKVRKAQTTRERDAAMDALAVQEEQRQRWEEEQKRAASLDNDFGIREWDTE